MPLSGFPSLRHRGRDNGIANIEHEEYDPRLYAGCGFVDPPRITADSQYPKDDALRWLNSMAMRYESAGEWSPPSQVKSTGEPALPLEQICSEQQMPHHRIPRNFDVSFQENSVTTSNVSVSALFRTVTYEIDRLLLHCISSVPQLHPNQSRTPVSISSSSIAITLPCPSLNLPRKCIRAFCQTFLWIPSAIIL